MKFGCFLLTILPCFLGAASWAYCTSYAPPDERSWEQTTTDFTAHEGQFANDGEYDGRRLKKLDSQKAAAFLLPLLNKKLPYGLRVKAIGALGWNSFQEAIPALSAIAKDVTEDEWLRAQSLNPGLRYMQNPQAVETAALMASDKSMLIRSGAYWVLSEHCTDKAIEILGARLRANDKPLLTELIRALASSKHLRAGQIIIAGCNFASLQSNEDLLWAYSSAMEQYRVAEARQNMLIVAQQTG